MIYYIFRKYECMMIENHYNFTKLIYDINPCTNDTSFYGNLLDDYVYDIINIINDMRKHIFDNIITKTNLTTDYNCDMHLSNYKLLQNDILDTVKKCTIDTIDDLIQSIEIEMYEFSRKACNLGNTTITKEYLDIYCDIWKSTIYEMSNGFKSILINNDTLFKVFYLIQEFIKISFTIYREIIYKIRKEM